MRELSWNKSCWKWLAFALAMFCATLVHGEAAAQSKPTCKTDEVYARIGELRQRIALYDKRVADAQVDVASAEAEVFTAIQALDAEKKRTAADRKAAVEKAKAKSLDEYRKEAEANPKLGKPPLPEESIKRYKSRAIYHAGEVSPEFYEKLDAAKAKLTEAEGRLRRASRELKASRDELDALEKLPECDKSHTMVPPADSGCSAGCLAGLPSGLSLEASAFTGGTFATSFGGDYDTSAFGGRFAAAFQLPLNVRFQLDFEGEGSGAYCATCGSHDYFSAAGHADWSATPNLEFGAFGGAQYARPTFGAPTSTNGFGGVEGRIFVPHAVFGGNAGYFDVSSGPGTLTKAWFAEGRAKFELAPVFGAWKFRGPTLELGAGYASGNLSGLLNNSASSAGWHATLAAPILDTPVQGFLKYIGHTNHVDGLGTVWTEHAVVAGVQINLGCQCEKRLEPMMPLPFVLRTVTTF